MRVGWRAKAAMQGVLSVVPGGGALNYQLQRKVTHSLPVSDTTIREYLETAAAHIAGVAPHLDRPLDEAVFYEFGAGWTLGTPLALAGLGVRHQTLIDIRPLARPELVADTVTRLVAAAAEMDMPFELPPWPEGTDLVDAVQRYGITYLAPSDARASGLPSGSIDVITSTSAFEHIPETDLVQILDECGRLLAPGGVVSVFVDYKDHYASFDDRIGPYNFLKFSERGWRPYSPALHNQNRLRHPEYLDIVDRCGFEILELEVVEASDADLRQLGEIGIDPAFARFSPEELGARDSRLVFVRRDLP